MDPFPLQSSSGPSCSLKPPQRAAAAGTASEFVAGRRRRSDLGGRTEFARWRGLAPLGSIASGTLARAAARLASLMLSLPSVTRVFVVLAPVDLRASFNGLFARVQNQLAADPLSGHWFVFSNRSRNRLKILFWDGSGLWVCAKRLEKGRFSWPCGEGAASCVRTEELSALLCGLEVRARADWYRR